MTWSLYKARGTNKLIFIRDDRAWLRLHDATAGKFPPTYSPDANGLRLCACCDEDCAALDEMWKRYTQ